MTSNHSSTMRRFVASGLAAELGDRRLRSGDALVTGCRILKTEAELARLRRANEATKAALAAAAQRVTVGMDEEECAALVRAAQEAAGLASVWVLALFGEAASFPHGTRARKTLREGELVLVDTGGSLHGYRSDITRTWSIGQPSDATRRAWEQVAGISSLPRVIVIDRGGVVRALRTDELDAALRELAGASVSAD